MRQPKNKLAEYRMRNLLSQEDVAAKLGVSQSYYGRLERNPKNINVGMMIQLKDILNAGSIDALVTDAV
jgi:transcriptional regulator with XRE-family HTH domain